MTGATQGLGAKGSALDDISSAAVIGRSSPRAGPRLLSRLLWHDWRVAANLLVFSPSTWRDRVRWFVGVPLLVVAFRIWLADLPPERAAHSVAIWSFVLATGLTWYAGKRLQYHRTEGLLPEQALRTLVAWCYLAAIIGAGAACIAMVIALLALHTLAACLAALGAGIVAGALYHGATRFGPVRRAVTAIVRHGSAWLRRPPSGIAAGMATGLGTLAASRVLDTDGAAALIGSVTFTAGFLLTNPSGDLVRFMAQSGFSVARTIGAHLRSLAGFVPVAAALGFAAIGPTGAAIVIVICAVVPVILCIRVLAYRIFGHRFADLIASLMSAVLGMIAFYAPAAAPFAVIALIAVLWRRARDTTWLLTA